MLKEWEAENNAQQNNTETSNGGNTIATTTKSNGQSTNETDVMAVSSKKL